MESSQIDWKKGVRNGDILQAELKQHRGISGQDY